MHLYALFHLDKGRFHLIFRCLNNPDIWLTVHQDHLILGLRFQTKLGRYRRVEIVLDS